MATLFEMRTPLSLRLPDGRLQCVAEVFPHADGVLYFDLWWHTGNPDETMHVIAGEVRGDGPWRIGDHIFNVLGCEGTNPDLAGAWAQWSDAINAADADYPPPPLVAAIARRMGAVDAA